jgi:hypothetical protein
MQCDAAPIKLIPLIVLGMDVGIRVPAEDESGTAIFQLTLD